MTALILMFCAAGVDTATVSSSACGLRFEGSRIVELSDPRSGETLRPEGEAFQLFDASNKPIPLGDARIEVSGAETVITASSPRGDQLKVVITDDGPDICLRLEATAAQPGLRAASFGLYHVRSPHSFIAPILGGMELTASTPVGHVSHAYPGNWQSQFALLQGPKGGFWVRSTDPDFGFKWVAFTRTPPRWSLEFKSENQAPFTERTTLRSPEWRISAYAGDWRAPTEQYRQWMEGAFDLTRFDPASWEARVRCVVITYPEGMTDKGLDLLAQRVRAEQTLIYIPSWRTHEYDVMYPDYDAAEGVAARVKAAQARGFRVMLHTDFPGVTGAHPFFEQVKQHQLRDAVTREPVGWWLEKKVPQSFYFINPASPIFRAEFVRRMQGIATDVGPDSIHLDVSAPTWNDGNGLIDGMSYPQGARRLHDDLAAALPNIVWGGEHLTESTLRHERFWQIWPGFMNNNNHPHPIVTALYWPYCRAYGYLGMPDPTLGEAEYQRYLEYYDNNGVLVTVPIHHLEKVLGETSPVLDALFSLARAHQDAQTEPDIAATVRNSSYVCWEGKDAAIRVEHKDRVSMVTVNGKAVFGHAQGARRARGLYPCGPWPVWDEDGAFALNPELAYLLTPKRPAEGGFHVTKLTGWATKLERCLDYPGAVGLLFAPYSPEPALRLESLFESARAWTRGGDTERPIEDGAVCQFERRFSGSAQRNALYMVPPWLKPTSEWITGMRFDVRVPAHAELRFWIGMDNNAQETDGVTFLVVRDGERVFERHYAEKRWEEVRVSLGNSEPKPMTLELATHPGPKNDRAWDLALFGDPAVYEQDTQTPGETFVDFRGPEFGGGDVLGAALVRPGELRLPPPGTQPVILFKGAPTLCTLPLDLLEGKLTPYTEQSSGSRQGSVFGSGRVHPCASNGVTRPSINAHTPSGGKTVLPWVGRLPANASRLHFFAGLGDGAQTDGVTFSVRINGAQVWDWFTAASGWREASIDLSPYAGRPVLMELVTEAGATNTCDWANWAEPRIE